MAAAEDLIAGGGLSAVCQDLPHFAARPRIYIYSNWNLDLVFNGY